MKNHSSFVQTSEEIQEFTQEENKLLVRAFYKLEKDGYVYSNKKVDDKGNKRVTFYISFDGLLALENGPLFGKTDHTDGMPKSRHLILSGRLSKSLLSSSTLL